MSDNAEARQEEIIRALQEAARLALSTAKTLAGELAVQRELAAQDRVQVARLLVLMQRLAEGVAYNGQVSDRLEQTTVHVAEDLAGAHARADAVTDGMSGDAADAALRSCGETAAEAATHPTV